MWNDYAELGCLPRSGIDLMGQPAWVYQVVRIGKRVTDGIERKRTEEQLREAERMREMAERNAGRGR